LNEWQPLSEQSRRPLASTKMIDPRPVLPRGPNARPETLELEDLVFDYSMMREAFDLAIDRMVDSGDSRLQQIGRIIPSFAHTLSTCINSVGVLKEHRGYWLVWNPDFLRDNPVEHTAYAICHEGAHVLLEDRVNPTTICGTPSPDEEQLRCFNVAADLEIEQLLAEIRDLKPPLAFRLGKDMYCPLLGHRLDFPPGRDADLYYHRLWYKSQKITTPLRRWMNEQKEKAKNS